jgi:hypothetical protein
VAVARVQANAGSNTTGTTLAVAFGSNVTAGNVIKIMAGWAGAVTLVSITDNLGNTYNQQLLADGAQPNLAMYWAENIGGGACTVTIELSASTPKHLHEIEESGAPTSGADAGAQQATGTGTTADSGAGFTPAAADCWIDGFVTNPSSVTYSSPLINGSAATADTTTTRSVAMYLLLSGTPAGVDAVATINISTTWRCGAGATEPAAGPTDAEIALAAQQRGSQPVQTGSAIVQY